MFSSVLRSGLAGVAAFPRFSPYSSCPVSTWAGCGGLIWWKDLILAWPFDRSSFLVSESRNATKTGRCAFLFLSCHTTFPVFSDRSKTQLLFAFVIQLSLATPGFLILGTLLTALWKFQKVLVCQEYRTSIYLSDSWGIARDGSKGRSHNRPGWSKPPCPFAYFIGGIDALRPEGILF